MTLNKWNFILTKQAEKDFQNLERITQERIVHFMDEKITQNPRATGKALSRDLKGYWSYRVGDYRIIANIIDQKLTIIAIKIDHRKSVYDF